MKKFSKPVVAVLVTLITSVLASLVFAVWLIAAPQETKAPTRDFVLSFDLGKCGEDNYGGTDTYPAKAYKANESTAISFVEKAASPATGTLEIADPTWTGYTFNGWKSDVTDDITLYGSTAISDAEHTYTFTATADVTFTATWSSSEAPATYTVEFKAGDYDGGTVPTGGTVQAGTYTIPVDEPTRTGYEFKGWYVEETYQEGTSVLYKSNGAHTTYDLQADVTFHAHWEAIDYTIVFKDTAHSTPNQTVTLNLDTHAADTVPTIENVTGYTLNEWKLEGKTSLTPGDPITFDKSFITTYFGSETTITFTAQWTVDTYHVAFAEGKGGHSQMGNVTIEMTGAGVPLPKEVSLEAADLTLPEAKTTGYTFNGWTYPDQAEAQKTFTLDAAYITAHTLRDGDEITFTADWTATIYTLTFTSAHSKTASNISATVENGVHALTYFTGVTGYEHTGWSHGAWTIGKDDFSTFELTVSDLETHSITSTTIAFTAKWEAIEYTIVYAHNPTRITSDGSVSMPTNAGVFTLDTTATKKINLSTPTFTAKSYIDYNFLNWSIKGKIYPASSSVIFTADMIPETGTEITVTANWEKDTTGWYLTGGYLGTDNSYWTDLSKMKKLTYSSGTYKISSEQMNVGKDFKLYYNSVKSADTATDWDTYGIGYWGSGQISRYFGCDSGGAALVMESGKYSFTITGTITQKSDQTTIASNIKITASLTYSTHEIVHVRFVNKTGVSSIHAYIWVQGDNLSNGQPRYKPFGSFDTANDGLNQGGGAYVSYSYSNTTYHCFYQYNTEDNVGNIIVTGPSSLLSKQTESLGWRLILHQYSGQQTNTLWLNSGDFNWNLYKWYTTNA